MQYGAAAVAQRKDAVWLELHGGGVDVVVAVLVRAVAVDGVEVGAVAGAVADVIGAVAEDCGREIF